MNNQRGFTLIELIIAIVIIGILVSIALPSYISHVEKAQCADGKALLSAAQQQMERGRTENRGRYNPNTALGSTHLFTVGASDVTAADYTLTASTTAAARISGDLTVTAAEIRGGSLADKCNW